MLNSLHISITCYILLMMVLAGGYVIAKCCKMFFVEMNEQSAKQRIMKEIAASILSIFNLFEGSEIVHIVLQIF